MIEATDIEKKSLEAHAELCAERYNALESRLDDMAHKITEITQTLHEIRDRLVANDIARHREIITWAAAIISGLLTVIGVLAHRFFV